MRVFSKAILVVVLLQACIPLVLATDEVIGGQETLDVLQEGPQEAPRDAAYYFDEHLLEAEAVQFPNARMKQKGEWKEDRFVFKETGAPGDIQVVKEIIKEKITPAIRFDPAGLLLRRLVFPSVPSASRLVLEYQLKVPAEMKQSVYVYLKISWGTHQLKKIRIGARPNQWIKENIDLGVVAFLTGNFPLTFELISDKVKGVQFLIFARTYR